MYFAERGSFGDWETSWFQVVWSSAEGAPGAPAKAGKISQPPGVGDTPADAEGTAAASRAASATPMIAGMRPPARLIPHPPTSPLSGGGGRDLTGMRQAADVT